MASEWPEGLEFRLLHVGVAVAGLDAAAATLAGLFGYRVVSGPFDDPVQKVRVTFLAHGEKDVAEIELIAALSEDSPVAAMLTKKRGGAYHLCFETSDLDGALEHAGSQDCVVLSGPVPAVAFGGRRIAWVYTRDRQLFELVEAAR